MERRLARETGLYRSDRGLEASSKPPNSWPRTSTGLKIGELFRALFIVMVGDTADAGKYRRAWRGVSQVTPISFSQGISKHLHHDLGVSKSYQQTR